MTLTKNKEFSKFDERLGNLINDMIDANLPANELLTLLTQATKPILCKAAMTCVIREQPDLDLKRQILLTGNKLVATVIESLEREPSFQTLEKIHALQKGTH